MKKRVVITGIGVVSPIGNDLDTFWSNIKKGVCGINYIESFDTSEYSVKVAGEIKNFDPKMYMDRKEAKRQDRFCQFSIAASQMAVNDANINLDNINKDKFGVIIGSGVGGMLTVESEMKKLYEKGPSRVSPFFIPMMISNMASGLVAIKFGAKGINFGIVTACATGANAIGEAFKKIQYDDCDIVLAGGAEASITPLSIAGFSSMTALCSSDDITRASIPFDKERSGFVMSEGSGIIVLESYDHAVKRNAKIYAELVGYGATCDAYHITAPEPNGSGAAKAMKCAIESANLSSNDIDYINAHGTSTPHNDKFETKAIKKAFGKQAYNIPISSTKSMTGHMIGAAGAIESIICAKSLQEGFIPATIGYKEPDPDCDLDYVPNTGRNKDIKYALSNSLGFGGHNASLVFKKYIEEEDK